MQATILSRRGEAGEKSRPACSWKRGISGWPPDTDPALAGLRLPSLRQPLHASRRSGKDGRFLTARDLPGADPVIVMNGRSAAGSARSATCLTVSRRRWMPASNILLDHTGAAGAGWSCRER